MPFVSLVVYTTCRHRGAPAVEAPASHSGLTVVIARWC